MRLVQSSIERSCEEKKKEIQTVESREQRGDESWRDSKTDCKPQERERTFSVLHPQDRESQKSSAPRSARDHDPLPPSSRRLWPPPLDAGGRLGVPHQPAKQGTRSGRRRSPLTSLSPPLSS